MDDIIEFDDINILDDLTADEGGAVLFVGSDGKEHKGYSLFVKSESDGEVFELILSERTIRSLLREIKDNL